MFALGMHFKREREAEMRKYSQQQQQRQRGSTDPMHRRGVSVVSTNSSEPAATSKSSVAGRGGHKTLQNASSGSSSKSSSEAGVAAIKRQEARKQRFSCPAPQPSQIGKNGKLIPTFKF